MSTKTTFKRIALVAVAALGLGVLSVAPSQANVSGLTVAVANGTSGLTGAASDSTTAATITIDGILAAGAADTVTVEFVAKSVVAGATVVPALQYLDSSTPTASTTRVDTETKQASTYAAVLDTSTSGLFSISGGNGSAATYVKAKFGLQFESATSTDRKAGTYTYGVIVKVYEGGTLNSALSTTKDVSIVIAAAASASEEPSAAYSAVYLGLGTTTTPSSDASAIGYVATASTTNKAANLRVDIRNASNAADTAIDTVTITVSGPGLVYASSAYTKSVKLIGVSSATYPIYADGNAGATTITVSLEKAAVSFTKSLSFYAAAAKTITAANFHPVLAAGANTGAVAVVATDANGTPWTGTAYIYASSATDALVAGSTTPVQCAAWNSTTGILCPVTALTVGTAKLKVIDASTVAAATATSNEVTVTVKGNCIKREDCV